MHVFALSLSLGLVALCLGRWAARMLPEAIQRFEGVAFLAFGLLLAWLADFDAWGAWGVPVREHWVGIALTGLAVGGLAMVWGELMGFVHGIARKSNDEAEVIERDRGLHVAA